MPHVSCVGCGWCCLSDQCLVSHHLHGYVPRCPELAWDAALGRYLCLLMAAQASHPAPSAPPPEISRSGRPDRNMSDPAGFHPDTSGPDLTELRQGLGCCAPLCSWRCDVRERG
ncbi:hypothetical protein [Nitratidesulfovibrio liaohensis]|uniref:hypothetical protein n=1 Tax=Nitratidesulfovibrio liaohensis TaxID=2604158 RepID=UPI00141EAABD|nr:hypothetical protein [Nitratidesulfovibrio liaohensis]NHZ47694.1 hypothetical protein [Nitratidesulfovibrio liaohensis]